MKVQELIQQAVNQLVSSESARLDAQLLLADVLGKDRTWLFTWPDAEVSEPDIRRFNEYLGRRIQGEPVAYILGKREFWGLQLQCNASTLIPRPETELLVELALQLSLPENPSVLDVGTGTGAIALALASERSHWQIQAVDFSAQAVELAISNKRQADIGNVHIYQSDWFEKVKGRFDLIVSNPPYIDPASHYPHQGDLRFEPRTALISRNEGMQDIAHITARVGDYLQADGWLLLEHGFDQQARVQACLKQTGFQNVRTRNDLAGLPRATLGQIVN